LRPARWLRRLSPVKVSACLEPSHHGYRLDELVAIIEDVG
jgi:hypothetical protein